MRSIRDSIAGLMGMVLIAALALAALKTDSEAWAGGAAMATCGILGLCVVGLVCRDQAERPRWLGRALFGWGYLAFALWLMHDSRWLPTIALLDALWGAFNLPIPPSALTKVPPNPSSSYIFELTGHCLWALALAALGGEAAAWLFVRRQPDETTEKATASAVAGAPASQPRPLLVAATGLALVTLTAALFVGLKPWLWAGMTFLFACGFLGVLVLGAILSPAGRRATWLGPALFGVGYLVLAFEWRPYETRWPPLPTVLLLEEMRPLLPARLGGYPFTTDKTAIANNRLLARLEQPIPVHFPTQTPLADVLQYVQAAAEKRDGEPLPIYVDPVGLSEAEKSLNSTVAVDLEGVALKHVLLACLKQLGLEYCVTDGYVTITAPSKIDRPPPGQDPYMIVGQCLLAMVAAMIGALASLIVTRREPRPAPGI